MCLCSRWASRRLLSCPSRWLVVFALCVALCVSPSWCIFVTRLSGAFDNRAGGLPRLRPWVEVERVQVEREAVVVGSRERDSGSNCL
jgi:hypothetical protein